MSRWLVSNLPSWLLLLGLIVVVAGGAVLILLFVRRRFPGLNGDEHNDATRFAFGVVGFVFAFFVGRASERFKGSFWHGAVSRGLVPVTLGLTAASAIVIASSSDYGWAGAAITAGTAITAYFMRIHPLWAFAIAALLGLSGLV